MHETECRGSLAIAALHSLAIACNNSRLMQVGTLDTSGNLAQSKYINVLQKKMCVSASGFWLGAVKIATFLPCGDPGSPATAALRSPATKRRHRQLSTDAGWHTAHINEPGTGKADQSSGEKMCAIFFYEFRHASVTVTVLHLCGNSGSPTSAALHSLPTPGPSQCRHCCRMLISADQATCHRRNRITFQMEDACPLPFDTASPTSHPAPALPFSPIGPTWVLLLLGFICV